MQRRAFFALFTSALAAATVGHIEAAEANTGERVIFGNLFKVPKQRVVKARKVAARRKVKAVKARKVRSPESRAPPTRAVKSSPILAARRQEPLS